MSPETSDTNASVGLSVRGLVVAYGDLRAVDGVDLDVAAGEVVALLGASGSGKSSLLRAVAGLEDVADGSVAWDGRGVVRVPVHKRGFGLMFQDGQLFEHRDVGGNIAYGLAGLSRARRGERVREMLELVGLPGFERRRVTTLSGGQAQRVDFGEQGDGVGFEQQHGGLPDLRFQAAVGLRADVAVNQIAAALHGDAVAA